MEAFDAFAVDVDEARQHDELLVDTFWVPNTDGEEEDKSISEASSADFDGEHDQTNPLNEKSAALPKQLSMTTFFCESKQTKCFSG
eukprot:CAMPEP_0174295560 /NCGR_PEP_ID=MMETSP0809-20121228/45184_1 /TAXON_ID=73025 ORGANISM="Eutreptiella gymnastica-like, Strain CCMP1594" /NCGR_SAMPLE_ID=MMETSP0809 /ASSEMBLY_ACC=CAM_ASM_000658 /LENGTH=85 /DNA_ID=CAMNT_0015397947 /DNA_START=12 /DNA_END=269 /DNA_ORIENTATION=+